MGSAAVCETYRDQFLGQPANAISSLAFVIAGTAILIKLVRRGDPASRFQRRQTSTFALLVVGVGAGSFIQHGPHPPWQAYAHDLPLAAVLIVVAVDATSDITGRELPPVWWIVPTVAMAPVVAAGSTASTIVQAALAVVAIGLSLVRAWVRTGVRRTLLVSLAILAAGSLIGTLADRTPLCGPDSVVQGHAVWHVLAAVALWRLAPAIGDR